MVPSDLRERPLTEAARAIIRSGNEDLIDAIRKIAPRYVDRPGGYTRILKLGPRRSDSTEMVYLELV